MAFQPTRFIHLSSYLETSCALTARFHPYHFSIQLTVSSKQCCLLKTEILPTVKGGYFLRHSLYLDQGQNPIRQMAWCSTLSGLSYPSSRLGSIERFVVQVQTYVQLGWKRRGKKIYFSYRLSVCRLSVVSLLRNRQLTTDNCLN